jgi:hypothetical protein
VAFINIWLRCGPCRQELGIEKLAKHFKRRNDTVVITFNIDSTSAQWRHSSGTIGTRSLVLRARIYATTQYADTRPWFRRSLIVDHDGTVCYEQTGFASDSQDRWFETTLKLLEERLREGSRD